MRNRKREPLVPLTDLYVPVSIVASPVGEMPREDEQVDYMARTYGVDVVRDHANRLAVSLEDAYRVRDARLTAEAELSADYIATSQRAEVVAAWQRARDTFWYERWMFTLRATPIPVDQPNPQVKQIADARYTLSVLVLEAERKAQIPEDVQRELSWPSLEVAVRYPEPSERPEDFPYTPPQE